MTDAPRTKDELLSDLTSGDAQRIWSAAWAVIRTRDADTLSFLADQSDEIEAATNGVDLGGMIRSNRESLAFALRKLSFVRARKGCLCELYPGNPGFDPERERRDGHVAILSKVEVPYASKFVCECTRCFRRWSVQEGEHHFAFWEWSPWSPGA